MEYRAKETGFAEHGTGFFWKESVLEVEKFGDKKEQLVSTKFDDDTGGQIFTLMRFILKKGGKKLAVSTVHLQSEKDPKGEYKRVMQIWEALYWLNFPGRTKDLEAIWKKMDITDKFKSPTDFTGGVDVMKDYAVIITGDFNA